MIYVCEDEIISIIDEEIDKAINEEDNNAWCTLCRLKERLKKEWGRDR